MRQPATVSLIVITRQGAGESASCGQIKLAGES